MMRNKTFFSNTLTNSVVGCAFKSRHVIRDLRRLYRKLVGGVLLKSERASLLLQETIYTGRRQFQSKIILFSTDPD